MSRGMTYYVQADAAGGVKEDLQEGGKCAVESAYADLKAGSQLVVRSSDGKVLATDSLGDAIVSGDDCNMVFMIAKVPRQDDDIYEVAVGNEARGTIIFTEAELASGDARLSVN